MLNELNKANARSSFLDLSPNVAELLRGCRLCVQAERVEQAGCFLPTNHHVFQLRVP